MPIYEFHHGLSLTATQKSKLARAVTDWHSFTFRAPRFIVNCRFIDLQKLPTEDNYVGGKPFKSNKLFVSLRSGTGRTEEQYKSMTQKLQEIWNEAMVDVEAPALEKDLKDVFIMGTLDSALERGWFLPMVCFICFSLSSSHVPLSGRMTGSLSVQPGKFEAWIREHTPEFRKLADQGDPVFKDLLEEIKARPEFQ